MSETNNSDKSVGAPPLKTTLHLKRPVEQGSVRQSFSHGRTKTVVVEKVKRRILAPGRGAARRRGGASGAGPAPAQAAPQPAKPVSPARQARPGRADETRRAAPAQDRRGAAHPDRRAARGARPGAHRRAGAGGGGPPPPGGGRRGPARARGARCLEREAAESRKRDEELRRAQEANFRRQSEDEARRRLSGGEPAPSPSIPRVGPTAPGAAFPERSRAPAGGEEDEASASSGARRWSCRDKRSRAYAAPAARRRAAQPWPADRHQRDLGRGGAHALGRRVPSAHPAAKGPRRAGSERENRARDRAA